MSASHHGFLLGIHDAIDSLGEFGHALAQTAAPDFLWQSRVTEEDLILPIRQHSLPSEELFADHARLTEFFDLLSFVVSQFISSFEVERPLMGLYVSGMSLVGIVLHQSPGSAEFGIAERCRVLLRSSDSVSSIPQEATATFVDRLRRHAASSPGVYWNASWVVVSLLATARTLSSRPSLRSDWGKELSDYINSPEWKAMFDAECSDSNNASEVRAMVELLYRSGVTSG